MEIIEVLIGKLKPNKGNLRVGLKDNDNMFKCLLASIVTFGLQLPLLINKEYEVISGDQILKVLKFLNKKSIPCIISDISKDKELDLSIALNKIRGDFSISGLREHFKKHEHSRGELEALGFESLEIDCLMTLDKFPGLKGEKIEDSQLKIF